MAYASFTLRRTESYGGSRLRGTPLNPGDPVDSGLRADGFIPLTAVAGFQSSFSAEAYRRDQIELSWELDTLLSNPTDDTLVPNELMIRASEYGEPVTVGDGVQVVRLSANDVWKDFYIDQASGASPHIGEGKWAYYSLFIKYKNAPAVGDSLEFWERVADLSLQIPRDFGSVEQLWQRIPTYYRELDTTYRLSTPAYTYNDGPLYRFIELFGWELDKIKTTIYDTMRINDPDVIHSSAINALASQVGLDFGKESVGTSKVRALLNNIGYLHRIDGTKNSIISSIAALTGSKVRHRLVGAFDYFDVHPHRVNLFSDPIFLNTTQSPSYAPSNTTPGASFGAYYTWGAYNTGGGGLNSCYGWGVYATTASSPGAASVSNGYVAMTFPASATVVLYSRTSFTWNKDLAYYATIDLSQSSSAVNSRPFSANFIKVSDLANIYEPTVLKSASYEAGTYVAGASASVMLNKDFLSDGRVGCQHPEEPGATEGQEVVPCFIFTVQAGETLKFGKPLFEYSNSSGDFFYGGSTNGGFIQSGAAGAARGVGIYDYRWGSQGANKTFSYYTLDFERTKKVAINYIIDSVAPVTREYNTNYFITWDVLQ